MTDKLMYISPMMIQNYYWKWTYMCTTPTCQDSQAKTTLHFCPSDSCLMGAVWAFPVIPYLPITFLMPSLSLKSGNMWSMQSKGVMSISRSSCRCWWYLAIFRWLCRLIMPYNHSILSCFWVFKNILLKKKYLTVIYVSCQVLTVYFFCRD